MKIRKMIHVEKGYYYAERSPGEGEE